MTLIWTRPTLTPGASYPAHYGARIIFDDPQYQPDRLPLAYPRDLVLLTGREIVRRHRSWPIAPALPPLDAEPSEEVRRVLLAISVAAVREQTSRRRGAATLDHMGLSASAVALQLDWRTQRSGKLTPDVARAKQLLDSLVVQGVLVVVRLENRRAQLRYTTPQIAGVPVPCRAEEAEDTAPDVAAPPRGRVAQLGLWSHEQGA